ncbi:hypothetical protein ABG067_002143 [Albugo candida]
MGLKKMREKTYNIVDVLEEMQEAAAAATKKIRKPSNDIKQWSNAFHYYSNLEEHVDDLIPGTLFDVDDNDEENQALSSARSLFTPVIEISKEGEALPVVASYAVVIKNASQLTEVQSLLTCGLSFSQCAKVVTMSESSKVKRQSLARITCALSLEMLSELLRREWTFSIRIDASTDSYDNSLLESHSLETKNGVTTDGAASMTGLRRGLASRLQAVASPVSPNYITVRWSPLDQFLDVMKSTSESLQGNNMTLGQQIIQLSSIIRP